ncbi:hypothetical protein ACFFK0_08415 [Paenibacillus chartarius]|uniref:Uncharacterized protein n=1 Tax=Paenibacillus chartarius TaxID=747481 RepID=A0ABV6DIM5_9BACL
MPGIVGYWTGGSLYHIAWEDDAISLMADFSGYYFWFSAAEYDSFHTFRWKLDGDRLTLTSIREFHFQGDDLIKPKKLLNNVVCFPSDTIELQVIRTIRESVGGREIPVLIFSQPLFYYTQTEFGFDRSDVLEVDWHRRKIEQLKELGAWA